MFGTDNFSFQNTLFLIYMSIQAIYQVLPRLFGNKKKKNVPFGSIVDNGCGKMEAITPGVLRRIAVFGFSHVWYTGLLEHATKTDYSKYGIAVDHPAVVKGAAGSPYAIKDYYDIDPDLATNTEQRMAEFEALVERTHQAGLKVIIDFVPNHVARQYHSDAHPKGVADLGAKDDTRCAFSASNNFYYIPSERLHCDNFCSGADYVEQPAKATGNDRFDAWPDRNDWYETVKLNYGVDYVGGHQQHFSPIPDTWKKMTDILLFWCGKGVDAFRCDMAEMVPVEFWHYATSMVKKAYPHIDFVAEVYNPDQYRNYIHYGGFDYLYNKVGLYDTLRSVMRHEASASAITGEWQKVDDIRDHMLNFLENHDEQRIASDFFCGNAQAGIPAFTVCALLDRAPVMIYAGQELGERGMDAEGFSGLDGRTTIFDYWHVNTLYRLCRERRDYTKAERQLYDAYNVIVGVSGRDSVMYGESYDLMYANYDDISAFDYHHLYAFIRRYENQTLLVVANFDEKEHHAKLRIPAHAFDFLNMKEGEFSATDIFTFTKQNIVLKRDDYTCLTIPAQGGIILDIRN